jgi:hypothetical protein
MSYTRITILLDQIEISALIRMAELDCRHPRDQVHFLIRAELEHRGLLTDLKNNNQTQPATVQGETHET